MLSKKFITSVCAAAIVTAVSAMPASAQQTMDSRTEFTFNQPVELPNVTLPPGTYIFRFVDATTGKKVMQVQAKDASNKTYGLFMTISAERPRPSDEAELRFLETPAGQPAAVKTWWYPGNTIGREFIYPRSQARRLAQATNETVLTSESETVTSENREDLGYMSPSGQVTELTDEQLVDAAANTPPEGAVDASTAARPTATSGAARQEGTMARASLPKTSTPLAGIGLVGLLSLLGAAALKIRA
jgi:hypothetical protein